MPKITSGDCQTHINPVRIRTKGAGNLRVTLFDLGEIDNSELADGALSTTTGRSINLLSNFDGEKILLDIRTTELEEWFEISNIWAYVKLTAISYPQP